MKSDNTVNGTCSNCGGCCRPCVQATQEEVDAIEEYIVANNIGELIYTKDGRLENICPFRDKYYQSCTIYPVRPKVCNLFMCNLTSFGFTSEDIDIVVNTDVSKGKGMHEIFFDNAEWKKQYMKENE
jgi:Fe-S-cluster containining protein